jgi:arginyl-tRNA synthetase
VDWIGGEAVEISMFSLWECNSDTHHGPVITNPAECV